MIRFRGRAGAADVADVRARLLSMLAEQGLPSVGEPFLMRYNSPPSRRGFSAGTRWVWRSRREEDPGWQIHSRAGGIHLHTYQNIFMRGGRAGSLHRQVLQALFTTILLLLLLAISGCVSPCPPGEVRCGDTSYKPATGICRNGTISPLPLWDICNGTPYDRVSQSCCMGVIEEGSPCPQTVVLIPTQMSGVQMVPVTRGTPGLTPAMPTPKSTPIFPTFTPVRACNATDYLTNPHCTAPPTPVRVCTADEYLTNPLCPPPAQPQGTPGVSRVNESAGNTTFPAVNGSSHVAQAVNSTG